MRRKKPSLSLHRQKKTRAERNSFERCSKTTVAQLKTTKRKTFFSPAKCPIIVSLQEMTPILSPMKSPFRSPLYKASPPKKRAKKSTSARILFEQTDCSISPEHQKNNISFPELDILELDYDTAIDKTVHFLETIVESSPASINEEVKSLPNRKRQTQEGSIESEKLEICDTAFKCRTVSIKNSDKSNLEHNTDIAEGVPRITVTTNKETALDKSTSTSTESGTTSINKSSKLQYADTSLSEVTGKIQKLTPEVVKLLASEDRLDLVLLQFLEQVNDKRFPLDNMAFRLWTEVVKWFECRTSTEMRYSEDTKQFWRLGYKLFGARFTNFMGGYKHHGQVVRSETVKGYYSPASASINFAVPNDKILRQFVSR
ncbi:uncharacterized protein LOC128232832 isoform X3 [Mya arenaria]|nr:uncharacterized protein LOC128232832 isoform X3 [Mya arenaria]